VKMKSVNVASDVLRSLSEMISVLWRRVRGEVVGAVNGAVTRRRVHQCGLNGTYIIKNGIWIY